MTRKRLASLEPTDAAPADGDEFSRATYADLGRRAAAEIAARGGALVDATFRRRADRRAFAETFADAAQVLFLECKAPAQVLAERAITREHGERLASDATLGVVLGESEHWEPLDEVPGDSHLIIRSDRPAHT